MASIRIVYTVTSLHLIIDHYHRLNSTYVLFIVRSILSLSLAEHMELARNAWSQHASFERNAILTIWTDCAPLSKLQFFRDYALLTSANAVFSLPLYSSLSGHHVAEHTCAFLIHYVL